MEKIALEKIGEHLYAFLVKNGSVLVSTVAKERNKK
tara:strand:- start:303 stop:410 length:108 start_codon:yes stop_codon:yes gene_type:complete